MEQLPLLLHGLSDKIGLGGISNITGICWRRNTAVSDNSHYRRFVMRVYTDQKETELVKAVCNCCGKNLLVENGLLKEECVHVEHDFGFFGKKDGMSHKFDLCEECYRRITEAFSIPVEEWERTELL